MATIEYRRARGGAWGVVGFSGILNTEGLDMKDWVVVDIEIKKEIGEDGLGWRDTDKLGVSCAVVYEFNTDRYRVYGDTDDELGLLQKRLAQADRVTGYNSRRFDLPVIFQTIDMVPIKFVSSSDDLLRRIWASLGLDLNTFTKAHGGLGLDAVAEATIGARKTGNGADAPKLYKAGRWAELIDYCMNDVKVTRDLALFIDKRGYIINPKSKTRLDIPSWDS